MPLSTAYTRVRFQSTLSMRRATDTIGHIDLIDVISIHALHEESDTAVHIIAEVLFVISIHALHEESDLPPCCSTTPHSTFQSTLSMRRATIFG